MEVLQFLIWPFVASLILTGIHAYLGVHVVERGVIFVDLALAQIAALGATIAILIGILLPVLKSTQTKVSWACGPGTMASPVFISPVRLSV